MEKDDLEGVNWLEKQLQAAKKEVDSWPEWKRKEVRRLGRPPLAAGLLREEKPDFDKGRAAGLRQAAESVREAAADAEKERIAGIGGDSNVYLATCAATLSVTADELDRMAQEAEEAEENE